MVGTGDYPRTDVRWPGSFDSAYLYHLIPRVILFREEHTPRVFVPAVDFISAKASTPEVARRGGPYALLTNMALFDFVAARGDRTLSFNNKTARKLCFPAGAVRYDKVPGAGGRIKIHCKRAFQVARV